jgi:hypothetical protein
MALNEANVIAAVTGAVWTAPMGSTAPTDYSTALDAAFKDVGFLDESGFAFDPNETVTKLKGWQKGQTVKEIRTGEDITIDFTMIELRSEVAQKLYWGEGATVAAGGLTVTVTDLSGSTPSAIVVEAVDGAQGVRYHFPKATLAQRGKVSLVSTNYQAMPVTLTAQKSGYFVKYWHSA